MDIGSSIYNHAGKGYEIRISLENGDLAHGDFLAEAYCNGILSHTAVRKNAMRALTQSMESGKSPFNDIVTTLKDNIRNEFNKAGPKP